MHFSTTTYLLSIFSLLNALPPTLASPASHSPKAITHRTTSDRACYRGAYGSLSLCKSNCGSGSSAGNCTEITTMLIKDSPPYDCSCPGDDTALINNDQSRSHPRVQPPTYPRKRYPRSGTARARARALALAQTQARTQPLKSRDLTAQELRFQAKAAQQQHQEWFVEKALEQPKPLPATPCKRGYHKTMDMCMANCGKRSGNCISVDGGNAVACQCKPGEL